MKRLLLPFLPCLLAAQTLPEPAHIQVFQTTAKAVRKGGFVTLRWSATGADQVRLDPLGLILPAKGELTPLVNDRTVYWLHVTNAAGGQSVPLVVDLLPEEGSPAVIAAPVPPPPSPSVVAAPAPPPPDPPKLAALPPVLPRLPVAAPRVLRAAYVNSPRRVWIQFAATVSPRGAARLRRILQRVAGADATIVTRNRRAGRPYRLLRQGPFPSTQAAQLRLAELSAAMQSLKMKPIIVFGPPQPLALGTTLIAASRLP